MQTGHAFWRLKTGLCILTVCFDSALFRIILPNSSDANKGVQDNSAQRQVGQGQLGP